MKRKILPILIVSSIFWVGITQAQVRLNVNVNIGQRPAWALPGNHVGDYYYFPEIDMYYSIPASRFVYFERGQWIYVSDLPRAYRHYDLHRGYKVVINDRDPFRHPQVYRDRYARQYMAYRPPVVIVDKRRGHDRWDRRDRDDDRRDRDRRRW
jgi:hypothetical protein